jgi:Domain of unknown function (DUF5615)
MDVHIPAAVTSGLRRRGIDVLTCQEDGQDTAGDEELLQRATDRDRVFVTQDDDFLAIAAEWQQAGRDFTGIAYAHQLSPGIGELIDDLELLSLAAEPDEINNRVTYPPLR